HEGTIWAGATSGLHRFRKPVVQVMATIFRHISGTPGVVFVDSRNNVWISPGDKLGASRINANDGAWQTIERRGTDYTYFAIAEDRTGRIWLSNFYEIGYVANNRFSPVHDESDASISKVWQFQRDARGELWAVSEGVGVYQITPGPPHLVVRSPRAETNFLVSDRFGIWIKVGNPVGVEQHLDGDIQFFPENDPDDF